MLDRPEAAIQGVSVAEIRTTLASAGAGGGELLLALTRAALGWAALAVLFVLGVTVAVTAVTGNLGPIEAAQGRGLGVGRLRVGGVALLAVAVLALGLSWAQLVPVVAGASRAVDASADGLVLLWHGWLQSVLAVVGSVLVLAGLLELWLARRQQTQALYQSVEQAREDMRRRGSRRA